MIGKQFNKDRFALIYITLLTVIALVYGFTIIPSPAKAQALSFDHKRVSDLGDLQAAIDNYYSTNSSLPKSLDDLSQSATGYTQLSKSDPQTKQPYEYHITSDLTYKLCATFQTDSSKDDPNTLDANNPSYSTYAGSFKHSTGHQCFDEKETDYNDNTDSGTGSDTTDPSGSPTPFPTDNPIHPTAAIISFTKNASCAWTPTFSLRGFAPDSTITVNSHGTLSDNCDANKTHSYSWTNTWNEKTDQDGAVSIEYLQGDFGDYTYTFTDSQGNSSSVHFSYDQDSSLPIIYPSTDSGASSGSAM